MENVKGYYTAFIYAVKIDNGETQYYRGILSCRPPKIFYLNVKKMKEYVMEDSLSVATLRKYQAEVLPSVRSAREAKKALFRALKRIHKCTVPIEVAMYLQAKEMYPDDFKGKVTYERAEFFVGKAID